MTPTLPHFLLVGAVLFALGTYCVVTRSNAVGILMGVELILNAANVNLVAFNHFAPGGMAGTPALTGQVFSLFVIVIAAAEAAVALAIVLAIYVNLRTIDVTQATALKE